MNLALVEILGKKKLSFVISKSFNQISLYCQVGPILRRQLIVSRQNENKFRLFLSIIHCFKQKTSQHCAEFESIDNLAHIFNVFPQKFVYVKREVHRGKAVTTMNWGIKDFPTFTWFGCCTKHRIIYFHKDFSFLIVSTLIPFLFSI